MKANSSKPLNWGLFILLLLFAAGCGPAPTPPEPAEPEDMFELPEIVVGATPTSLCDECPWGFTLHVERFGVIEEQGYRSEVTQEGELQVIGDINLWGEGQGDLTFEIMMDAECPVTMQSNIEFTAIGTLNQSDCTLEINLVYESTEADTTSPCVPEDVPLPPLFSAGYLGMVDNYPPEPLVADLAALTASVSRKEPLGNIDWTASYWVTDFHGIDRYGCFEDVKFP